MPFELPFEARDETAGPPVATEEPPGSPGFTLPPDARDESEPKRSRTQLTPEEEPEFRKSYAAHAQRWGINPDPDDERQKYDYRGAWKAGAGPDETGHWPSQWKDDDHPRRFLNLNAQGQEDPSAPLVDTRQAEGFTLPPESQTTASGAPKYLTGVRRMPSRLWHEAQEVDVTGLQIPTWEARKEELEADRQKSLATKVGEGVAIAGHEAKNLARGVYSGLEDVSAGIGQAGYGLVTGNMAEAEQGARRALRPGVNIAEATARFADLGVDAGNAIAKRVLRGQLKKQGVPEDDAERWLYENFDVPARIHQQRRASMKPEELAQMTPEQQALAGKSMLGDAAEALGLDRSEFDGLMQQEQLTAGNLVVPMNLAVLGKLARAVKLSREAKAAAEVARGAGTRIAPEAARGAGTAGGTKPSPTPNQTLSRGWERARTAFSKPISSAVGAAGKVTEGAGWALRWGGKGLQALESRNLGAPFGAAVGAGIGYQTGGTEGAIVGAIGGAAGLGFRGKALTAGRALEKTGSGVSTAGRLMTGLYRAAKLGGDDAAYATAGNLAGQDLFARGAFTAASKTPLHEYIPRTQRAAAKLAGHGLRAAGAVTELADSAVHAGAVMAGFTGAATGFEDPKALREAFAAGIGFGAVAHPLVFGGMDFASGGALRRNMGRQAYFNYRIRRLPGEQRALIERHMRTPEESQELAQLNAKYRKEKQLSPEEHERARAINAKPGVEDFVNVLDDLDHINARLGSRPLLPEERERLEALRSKPDATVEEQEERNRLELRADQGITLSFFGSDPLTGREFARLEALQKRPVLTPEEAQERKDLEARNQEINGAYDGANNTLRVNIRRAKAMSHEGLHAMLDRGLIVPEDGDPQSIKRLEQLLSTAAGQRGKATRDLFAAEKEGLFAAFMRSPEELQRLYEEYTAQLSEENIARIPQDPEGMARYMAEELIADGRWQMAHRAKMLGMRMSDYARMVDAMSDGQVAELLESLSPEEERKAENFSFGGYSALFSEGPSNRPLRNNARQEKALARLQMAQAGMVAPLEKTGFTPTNDVVYDEAALRQRAEQDPIWARDSGLFATRAKSSAQIRQEARQAAIAKHNTAEPTPEQIATEMDNVQSETLIFDPGRRLRILTNKDRKRITVDRNRAIFSALETLPEDPADVGAMRKVTNRDGEVYYEGLYFSDNQMLRILALDNAILPKSQKEKLLNLNQRARDEQGSPMMIDYYPHASAGKSGASVGMTVRIGHPTSFHVSKAGNFLFRMFDHSHFDTMLDKEVARGQNSQVLRPWWDASRTPEENRNAFIEDMATYLANHQRGARGETSIGRDKADAINAFFGIADETANPLVTNNNFYRFRRFERTASIQDVPGRMSMPIARDPRGRRYQEYNYMPPERRAEAYRLDMNEQLAWFGEEAARRGYPSLDRMLVLDPLEFNRLAAEWRRMHPRPGEREPGVSPERPGGEVARARVLRYRRAARAMLRPEFLNRPDVYEARLWPMKTELAMEMAKMAGVPYSPEQMFHASMGPQLGSGSYGEVYADRSDPGSVIKRWHAGTHYVADTLAWAASHNDLYPRYPVEVVAITEHGIYTKIGKTNPFHRTRDEVRGALNSVFFLMEQLHEAVRGTYARGRVTGRPYKLTDLHDANAGLSEEGLRRLGTPEELREHITEINEAARRIVPDAPPERYSYNTRRQVRDSQEAVRLRLLREFMLERLGPDDFQVFDSMIEPLKRKTVRQLKESGILPKSFMPRERRAAPEELEAARAENERLGALRRTFEELNPNGAPEYWASAAFRRDLNERLPRAQLRVREQATILRGMNDPAVVLGVGAEGAVLVRDDHSVIKVVKMDGLGAFGYAIEAYRTVKDGNQSDTRVGTQMNLGFPPEMLRRLEAHNDLYPWHRAEFLGFHQDSRGIYAVIRYPRLRRYPLQVGEPHVVGAALSQEAGNTPTTRASNLTDEGTRPHLKRGELTGEPYALGDIKPDNFMADEEGNIVPTDLMADRIDEGLVSELKAQGKVDQRFMPRERDREYLDAVKRDDMATAQRMVDEAAGNFIEQWPSVEDGKIVSGLETLKDVPNTSSINASLTKWTSYGVREVPMSVLTIKPSEDNRGLAESIKTSGRIKPLIVVVEPHPDGPAYVLEGSHRIDALKLLGVRTFPALVIYDGSSRPVTRDERGRVIPLSQRFNTASADLRFMPAENKFRILGEDEQSIEPSMAAWIRRNENRVDWNRVRGAHTDFDPRKKAFANQVERLAREEQGRVLQLPGRPAPELARPSLRAYNERLAAGVEADENAPPQHREAAAAFRADPEGRNAMIEKEVARQRRETYREWRQYLEHENPEYSNSPYFRHWVYEGLNSDLRPDWPDQPPMLDRAALAKLWEDVQASGRYPNFSRAYGQALLEQARRNSELAPIEGSERSWLHITKLTGRKKGDKAKIAQLQNLSAPGWCTRQSMAETYLRNGDFWLLVNPKKGRAELALRWIGGAKDGRLDEVRHENGSTEITLDQASSVRALLSKEKFQQAGLANAQVVALEGAEAIFGERPMTPELREQLLRDMFSEQGTIDNLHRALRGDPALVARFERWLTEGVEQRGSGLIESAETAEAKKTLAEGMAEHLNGIRASDPEGFERGARALERFTELALDPDPAPSVDGLKVRDFTEGDWSAFSGAAPLLSGEPPQMAELAFRVRGQEEPLGIAFIAGGDDTGELQYVSWYFYSLGDDMPDAWGVIHGRELPGPIRDRRSARAGIAAVVGKMLLDERPFNRLNQLTKPDGDKFRRGHPLLAKRENFEFPEVSARPAPEEGAMRLKLRQEAPVAQLPPPAPDIQSVIARFERSAGPRLSGPELVVAIEHLDELEIGFREELGLRPTSPAHDDRYEHLAELAFRDAREVIIASGDGKKAAENIIKLLKKSDSIESGRGPNPRRLQRLAVREPDLFRTAWVQGSRPGTVRRVITPNERRIRELGDRRRLMPAERNGVIHPDLEKVERTPSAGWLAPDGSVYALRGFVLHSDSLRSHPEFFGLDPRLARDETALDDDGVNPGLVETASRELGWHRLTRSQDRMFVENHSPLNNAQMRKLRNLAIEGRFSGVYSDGSWPLRPIIDTGLGREAEVYMPRERETRVPLDEHLERLRARLPSYTVTESGDETFADSEHLDRRIITMRDEGGEIVAEAIISDRSQGRTLFIDWVQASVRGRGYGRAIFYEIARRARDEGYRNIAAKPASPDAQRAFRKLGLPYQRRVSKSGVVGIRAQVPELVESRLMPPERRNYTREFAERGYEAPELKSWIGPRALVRHEQLPTQELRSGEPVVLEVFSGASGPERKPPRFFTGSRFAAQSLSWLGDSKGAARRVSRTLVRLDNPLVYDAEGWRGRHAFPKALREALLGGHDGVIVRNVDDSRHEGVQMNVPFAATDSGELVDVPPDPALRRGPGKRHLQDVVIITSLRSSAGNIATLKTTPSDSTDYRKFMPKERREGEPLPLASRLERVIERQLPERFTAAQALATIRNAGVKEDELRWARLGLEREPDQKLTRQELLDRARRLGTVVSRHELRDPDTDPDMRAELDDRAQERYYELVEAEINEALQRAVVRRDVPQNEAGDALGPATFTIAGFEELLGQMDRADANLFRAKARRISGRPLVDREPVFDDENKATEFLDEVRVEVDELLRDRDWHHLAQEAQQQARDELGETQETTIYAHYTLGGARGSYHEVVLGLENTVKDEQEGEALELGEYSSPHFSSTPNYLAHYRADVRRDGQGDRGLFVEEFQSDRHQEGRRTGYVTPQEQRARGSRVLELTRERDRLAHERMEMRKATGLRVNEIYERGKNNFEREYEAAVRRAREEAEREGLIQLLGDHRDHWVKRNFLMDRLLREQPRYLELDAALDRTSLELDRLRDERHRVAEAPFAKTWPLLLFKVALTDAINRGLKWVGWTNGETQAARYGHTVARDEGMAGFYDEMVPRMVGRWVKQFGGSVTEGRLASPAERFWRVDITPEMQEAHRGGKFELFMPREREYDRGSKEAPLEETRYEEAVAESRIGGEGRRAPLAGVADLTTEGPEPTTDTTGGGEAPLGGVAAPADGGGASGTAVRPFTGALREGPSQPPRGVGGGGGDVPAGRAGRVAPGAAGGAGRWNEGAVAGAVRGLVSGRAADPAEAARLRVRSSTTGKHGIALRAGGADERVRLLIAERGVSQPAVTREFPTAEQAGAYLAARGFDQWRWVGGGGGARGGARAPADAQEAGLAGRRGMIDTGEPSAAIGRALGEGEALMPQEREPLFHSAVLRAVEEAQQERATPQQWLALLRRTPGIKREELEWTGVEDWLEGQSGTVTREAVAAQVRENQVVVKEVVKGEGLTESAGLSEADEQRIRDRGRELAMDDLREDWQMRVEPNPESQRRLRNRFGRTISNEDEYAEAMIGTVDLLPYESTARMELFPEDWIDNDPRWDQRRLRTAGDGRGYRELLLVLGGQKLPDTSGWTAEEIKPAFEWDNIGRERMGEPIVRGWLIRDSQGQVVKDIGVSGVIDALDAEAALERARNEMRRVIEDRGFQSGHWNERNVLAHVRFDERKGLRADEPIGGEDRTMRVLHIDEVQSDWHQKGRRSGYRGSPELEARQAELLVRVQQAQETHNRAVAAQRRLLGEVLAAHPDGRLRKYLERYSDEELQAAVSGSGEAERVIDDVLDWLRREHQRGNEGEQAQNIEWQFRLYGAQRVAREADNERYTAEEEFAGVERRAAPDAPFKSSWRVLAMKRMLRWAAENGFDAISWTRGIDQVRRYTDEDRKALERLSWRLVRDVENDGTVDFELRRQLPPGLHREAGMHKEAILVRADARGRDAQDNEVLVDPETGEIIASVGTDAPGMTLEEVVGRRIAERILSRPVGRITRRTEPELSWGGEGMKGAYDEIMPKEMNRLLSRLGARVEEGKISTANSGVVSANPRFWQRVHLVEVTPQMRELFQRSQPLFMPLERQRSGVEEGAQRLMPPEIQTELPLGQTRPEGEPVLWDVSIEDGDGPLAQVTVGAASEAEARRAREVRERIKRLNRSGRRGLWTKAYPQAPYTAP